MKRSRFWCCSAVFLLITMLWLSCLSVSAEPAVSDIKKIELVTTENTVPPDVYYYNNRTQYTSKNFRPAQSAFTWSIGRNNQPALNLNGKNQYLRLPTAEINDLDAFTFATWISWNGNSSANKVDEQKLLSFYGNQYFYLTVSLHSRDAENQLDGPCLEWASPDADPQRLYLKTDDNSTFSFPENEWHHMAVVISESSFSLYIDGNLYLHADIHMEFSEMSPPKLRIGSGFGTEPTLNASLQNAAFYNAALTNEQIALLAQDIDPLTNPNASTTTAPLATRPTTAPTAAVRNEPFSGQILGLPLGLIITLLALVALFVAFTVVFHLRDKQPLDSDFDGEGSV